MSRPDSVTHLQELMAEGGERAFMAVPAALANVIRERQWEGRTDQQGRPFRSFEEFVAYKLWFGLESTIDDLLAYCRKREDVQQLIKGEVGPAEIQGRHLTMSGEESKYGNNPTYTLRRLRRDRPDLADKVVAGELSANAAAIEAGFRKQPSPFQQVMKLLPKLTEEELETLHHKLHTGTRF